MVFVGTGCGDPQFRRLEWELSSGTFPSHGFPRKEWGALSVLALLTADNPEDFGISVESRGASSGATVAS